MGLDPQTRNAIWDHVRRLREQVGIATVFMTTHYMDEAENCDRIAIIDQGKLQAVDTPETLKKQVGGDKIIVRGDDALKADLASRYQVEVAGVDGELHFLVPNGAEFIPRLIADFNGRIKAVQLKQPTLSRRVLEPHRRAHPRRGRACWTPSPGPPPVERSALSMSVAWRLCHLAA